ncbi:exodeoxyribonuclease I [Neptunomonas qingdaonensis]|uniref:Exodeoxyribonuclease I n=1 Tax=Neptunomonas qingdaonensis TaxID=1045558 RepID=A0A1I2THQ0_9GAMM|nr:exodeoxyribonuclease I [Neptunomonas qingdaonensis]SFG64420.1 Exodeoxyribonuclease I subunit C [Neptunomonas qingdaonensis]
MTAERTFFWHDYETFGIDPKRDRPVQFAGVRTDENLNIIDEPVMLYCKPADDTLPHPQACLITGITPQKAIREGVCEAEFIKCIHDEFTRPGTCAVGYNSIRFDDEVTRYTLYRNFFDPYAREWQNDCSRWDIIDMLRLTRALRPEGIVWPEHEDGTPSLRLEDLTKANGIDHGHAHDALSDVYATIAMAKLVKERQPKLYEFTLANKDKASAQKMLDVSSMKPVLHVSSRYAAALGNLAVVAPLIQHPVNRNSILVWDLRADPAPLLTLSVDEIRHYMYLAAADRSATDPVIALKQVHVNKCPILAPAGMLNKDEAARFSIDGDMCRAHLALLRNSPELKAKLADVLSVDGFESDGDPDHMLYSGGFFNDTDKKMMQQVRESDPEALAEMQLAFQDPRLEEMLFRYRARNYPLTLNDDEQSQWEQYRSDKLLKPDKRGLMTMKVFYEQLNALYQDPELSMSNREVLEELAIYAESIYPMENSW